jgi:hypothetical protein
MVKPHLKNLKPLIVLLCAMVGSYWVWRKLTFIHHTQFVELAYSFLRGRLFLTEPVPFSSWQDSAPFGGKSYVYFGPAPALLLLPAVALFGLRVPQQLLSLLATAASFLLLRKLAKTLGLKSDDALWLAIAFLFGSIYLSLALLSISAYVAQVVGFAFVLGALAEYFDRRRWLLIGGLLALAGVTRYSLYLSLPFFLLEIAQDKNENKMSALLRLAAPIAVSVLFLGLYNQARFGNPLETGYKFNTTFPPGVKEALQYGFFSLRHIPANLYFFLFKGPEAVQLFDVGYVLKYPFLRANEWGMSIVFTSPFFLYLLLCKPQKGHILSCIVGSMAGILPALLYAGVGVYQFGYRYALDIYPFLFVLLASVFAAGMPRLAKWLITYSIAFDLFLMGSIWSVYPF